MKHNTFQYHTDYKLLMPGKSWIFVNPTTGCTLDCSYCVEQKDAWFEKKINHIFTPGETIKELYSSDIIFKDRTPLTFYNFSDPFLPQNKNNLMKILRTLDNDNWTNKVGLISKVHPSIEYLTELSELKNLKLGLFVSYANLIPGVEKASPQSRLQLMEDAYKLKIPTICYARPLVKEWTNESRLIELAHQIEGKVDATVLSGMRLTPEIVNSLNEHGVIIPKQKGFTNKEKDKNLFNQATNIIRNTTQEPVFWHTSCAMSYLFVEPDYNSHDIREKLSKDSCGFPCSSTQQNICEQRQFKTTNEELSDLISRLNKDIEFRKENNTIYLKGDNINLEDVSYLRHLVPEFVKEDE